MSESGRETEAKFYVQDLNRMRARLQNSGAPLIQQRILEKNIRFDLPGASLRSEGRVLRLRRDTEARFTYKGPSTTAQGVMSRTEIEFTVEDFAKAQEFLEALGYQKLVYYEKYRTTYEMNECHVMLDELPYGDFIEIEGETIDAIRKTTDELNLNWKAAVGTSYHSLFERVCKSLELSYEDLSFENFSGIKVMPVHLGVQAGEN